MAQARAGRHSPGSPKSRSWWQDLSMCFGGLHEPSGPPKSAANLKASTPPARHGSTSPAKAATPEAATEAAQAGPAASLKTASQPAIELDTLQQPCMLGQGYPLHDATKEPAVGLAFPQLSPRPANNTAQYLHAPLSSNGVPLKITTSKPSPHLPTPSAQQDTLRDDAAKHPPPPCTTKRSAGSPRLSRMSPSLSPSSGSASPAMDFFATAAKLIRLTCEHGTPPGQAGPSPPHPFRRMQYEAARARRSLQIESHERPQQYLVADAPSPSCTPLFQTRFASQGGLVTAAGEARDSRSNSRGSPAAGGPCAPTLLAVHTSGVPRGQPQQRRRGARRSQSSSAHDGFWLSTLAHGSRRGSLGWPMGETAAPRCGLDFDVTPSGANSPCAEGAAACDEHWLQMGDEGPMPEPEEFACKAAGTPRNSNSNAALAAAGASSPLVQCLRQSMTMARWTVMLQQAEAGKGSLNALGLSAPMPLGAQVPAAVSVVGAQVAAISGPPGEGGAVPSVGRALVGVGPFGARATGSGHGVLELGGGFLLRSGAWARPTAQPVCPPARAMAGLVAPIAAPVLAAK